MLEARTGFFGMACTGVGPPLVGKGGDIGLRGSASSILWRGCAYCCSCGSLFQLLRAPILLERLCGDALPVLLARLFSLEREVLAEPEVLLGVTSLMAPERSTLLLVEVPEKARDMRGELVALIPSSLRRASAVCSSCAAKVAISTPSKSEPLVERSMLCAIALGECKISDLRCIGGAGKPVAVSSTSDVCGALFGGSGSDRLPG